MRLGWVGGEGTQGTCRGHGGRPTPISRLLSSEPAKEGPGSLWGQFQGARVPPATLSSPWDPLLIPLYPTPDLF